MSLTRDPVTFRLYPRAGFVNAAPDLDVRPRPAVAWAGMASWNGVHRKQVGELSNGDETADYGVVEYREGRKVWFKRTIVTFPSTSDEVEMTSSGSLDERY